MYSGDIREWGRSFATPLPATGGLRAGSVTRPHVSSSRAVQAAAAARHRAARAARSQEHAKALRVRLRFRGEGYRSHLRTSHTAGTS